MAFKAHLSIYRSRSTGDFVLMNYVVHPRLGALTDAGPLVSLSDGEMMVSGLAQVLRGLEEFANRTYAGRGGYSSMSPEEQARFEIGHDLVGVRMDSATRLALTPQHHVSDPRGFQSGPDKDQPVVVRLPTTPEEFFAAVRSAFAMAD